MDNSMLISGTRIETTKTEQIKNTIAGNLSNLLEIKERLYRIQENLLGPIPMQNGKISTDKPVPNGIIDDILKGLLNQDETMKIIFEVICNLEKL